MEKEIEERLRGPISFRGMMGIIVVAQEKHLKRTRKIKIGVKGKDTILSAPWMDRKGQMLIKLRKIKSRAWRHARKKNAPQREQTLLKRRYEMQKRATSIYLGKRKGDWEKEKILKARTNSKILWDFTRNISGKTKKKDEEAYIYIDGEKKAIEVVWRMFIETWKREIYQKVPRMDLTFWYGTTEEIGLNETVRREEAENRS